MGDEIRRRQYEHVKRMRQLIAEEKLVLFVGEGLSALGAASSIDDWWKLVENFESGQERALEKEEDFIRNLPENRSKAHDNIRGLGRFPLILTTNLDSLIEQLLWNGGPRREAVRLDQAIRLSCRLAKNRDVVVKCFGDCAVATEITADSKRLMMNLCEGKRDENSDDKKRDENSDEGKRDENSDENSDEGKRKKNSDGAHRFLKELFDEKSVLFLGCNPDHPLTKGLLEHYVIPAKAKHYLFQEANGRAVSSNGSLSTLQLNMPIDEFILNLSTGKQTNFERGKTWERFYLPSQREEYLKQQLALEERSSKITFLTATITNALATDEVLERVNRPKLENLFDNDPFIEKSSEAVRGAYEAMKARRDNLVKTIETGKVPVRAMFLLEEFRREISSGSEELRKMVIRKYADAALKCNSFLHSSSSFEVFLIPTKDDNDLAHMKKETFAFLNLSGDTADAAVCYAAQASGGGGGDKARSSITTNLINVNGDKVQARSKLIDQTLARAMSPEESLVKLVGILLQHDRKIGGAIESAKLQKLERLDQLLGLTEGNEIDMASMEKIGEGSFGSVYRGQLDGRTVAVKVMTERGKESDLEAFIREFESMKNSQHPNIVQVEACFRSKSRFGLVMEYVDGCNLWTIIQEAALTRDQARDVAVAVARALAHLHRMKIIHRDVKPDNILIGREFSAIKLGDFGLARATEGTQDTKTQLRGHWRYMAPEVMTSKRYTTKADVYSYGCTLIEAISGQKVFEDIATPQLGVHRGQVRPRIPAYCVERYGSDMRHAIEMAIAYEAGTRAGIDDVLTVLEGKKIKSENDDECQLAIQCLGTGTGITGIISEEPSSSFVLLYHNQPFLMVDIGYGVCRQYRRIFFERPDDLPENLFITHNHGDHASELPPLLYVDACRRLKDKERKKVTIYSGPEVEKQLKEHRLHEQMGAVLPDGSIVDSPEKLADWKTCSLKDKVYLDAERNLAIRVHKSQHSLACYGFVLYWQTKPLLGFSGDSGFNEKLYDELSVAPYVIVDAREKGTREHASFEQVISYFEKKKCEVYVTGYGGLEQKPVYPSFAAFETGSKVTLRPELAAEWADEKRLHKEKEQEQLKFQAAGSEGYPLLEETLGKLSGSS